VCDENYFIKYQITARQIREKGKWTDDIVCLPSALLAEQQAFKDLNEELKINCEVLPLLSVDEDKKKNGKVFQYHKYHVFDTLFKKWDYVFYVDVGMDVRGDLNRFKKLSFEENKIYAHSDSFPTYQSKLTGQFSGPIENGGCDYFQTTMFIYHTSLTNENTVGELVELTNKLPAALWNDQGVIAYYYCVQNPKWIQVPLRDEQGFLYDYIPRIWFPPQTYVMLKMPNYWAGTPASQFVLK
jgi:lipopolysaccharide biosynthesis glycosyltransferase